MKSNIKSAIRDTVSEIDESSIENIIKFLTFLDRLELYMLYTPESVTTILENVYKINQSDIFSFLIILKSNLLIYEISDNDIARLVDNCITLLINSPRLDSKLKDSLSVEKKDELISLLYIIKLNIVFTLSCIKLRISCE